MDSRELQNDIYIYTTHIYTHTHTHTHTHIYIYIYIYIWGLEPSLCKVSLLERSKDGVWRVVTHC